jgi:hypothetical protein
MLTITRKIKKHKLIFKTRFILGETLRSARVAGAERILPYMNVVGRGLAAEWLQDQ